MIEEKFLMQKKYVRLSVRFPMKSKFLDQDVDVVIIAKKKDKSSDIEQQPPFGDRK